MRKIIVKYEGSCQRCGQALEPGQDAVYEKSMGIFCIGHEPTEVEDIRRFRLIKAEARAERLGARADCMDQEASRKMAAFNEARKDLAWLTQPGYIPGREKVTRRYDAGVTLSIEADRIRARADSLIVHKSRVAGDAERHRQAQREKLDKLISKGSRVKDFCFGLGTVIGVYSKSYRIKFDGGGTYARDKSYVRPVNPSQGEDNEKMENG